MTDIESRLNSTTQFNEFKNNVLPLPSYYANEELSAENYKLFCFFLAMIITTGFIIAAAFT